MHAATVALTLILAACGSPNRVIQPVIYSTDNEAGRAMRSAPVILVVESVSAKLPGKDRMVAKPAGVGGPMMPTIPLYLARIRAKVLLTVRGDPRNDVEFYSWVWASGKHGGPRLFNPTPGTYHVVFLRPEGKYLHTVGDYPSYDLELRSRWIPDLLSYWRSGRAATLEPLRRVVALRLRAEFEALSEADVQKQNANAPIQSVYALRDAADLVRLVGPFMVASELDQMCVASGNRLARLAACDVTAQMFPGRCGAYQLAIGADGEQAYTPFLVKALKACESRIHGQAEALRSGELLSFGFYGEVETPEQRRDVMRVYASAMDPEIRRAGCKVAATMPEAGDVPECHVPPQKDRGR